MKYLRHLTDTARAFSVIPIHIAQADRCSCGALLLPGRTAEEQGVLKDGFSTPAALFTLKEDPGGEQVTVKEDGRVE